MIFNYKQSGFVALFLFGLLFSSCEKKVEQKQKLDYAKLEKEMLAVNSRFVSFEDANIDRFVKRYNFKMNKTATGLRWMILKHGQGEKLKPGQTINIEYKVYLLDGQLIYSSEKDGNKSIKLGHTDIESGLEEGILLLNVGDKARFILPSHLAFGLGGDGNKIPAKSSLLYEVKLIDLE